MPGTTSLAPGAGWRRYASRLGAIPGVAYLLVLLWVWFALDVRGFASVQNLAFIGVQSSILLLLALPMTLIIMSEGLDLSLGAVLGLAGVALASLLAAGVALPLAMLGALAVGGSFGLLNGLLVVWLGFPPFVATLGTLGAAQGLALVFTGGQSVVGIGRALPTLYASGPCGLPCSVLVAAAAYGVFHWLLYHTPFGVRVFAIGGNREALTLAGVHARVAHVAIYLVGGLMAGFGALLLTGRMNAGHPTAAIGMEFEAIAAVVVGGTSFERGNGWLPGTVLGVLAIGVLRNGLNVMAVPSALQVASVGLLVIAALLIDSVRAEWQRRRA